MDVTSENDIFFFYFDEVDEEEFNKRRIEQKLTLDYCQYATVLTQLLNGCATEPQTQHAILTIEDDGQRARLDFIKVAYTPLLTGAYSSYALQSCGQWDDVWHHAW